MRSATTHLVIALLAAGFMYALLKWELPYQQPAHAQTPLRLPAANNQETAPVQQPAHQAHVPMKMSPEEAINVHVYQKVNRSVINITTRSVEVDDFFLLTVPREGSGSGSILDKQGHILTNYHVIEGARRVAVTLYDGSMYEGRLVGSDPNNDLAVIKIDAPAEKLVPITWGDSSSLVVGLRVFAIGNPFGLERTLTTGIISSLNRSLRSENNRIIRGVIQTDAAINPGNSGGPLLNTQGEMIGITTAIIGRTRQSSGVGLAIPVNTVKRVVGELIKFGRVIRPDSGIFSVYELEQGLLIARLVPDGPAEKAGLRGPQIITTRRGGFVIRGIDRSKADLIVAVDGKKAATFDDFLTYIESKQPGDTVTITVIREGERVDVDVRLEESRE